MKNFIVSLLIVLALCMGINSKAFCANKLQIVTSTTFYADLAKQIGKEYVEVKAVANPKFNLHFIQPKPSDIRSVTRADLVIYTGLDLEAWWQPLMEASGNPRLFPGSTRSLSMAQGVKLLDAPDASVTRAQGDTHLFGNPHIQTDPRNALIMARTIEAKLKEIDPSHAEAYTRNADEFTSVLQQKIQQWKAMCASCQGKEVLSYHEDIRYFVDFLGIECHYYLEPKPGVPPTPKHLEFLEQHAKEHSVMAILMPTYFPQEAAQRLGQRIGCPVVTIAQSPMEVDRTSDVISYYDYNFNKIAETQKT